MVTQVIWGPVLPGVNPSQYRKTLENTQDSDKIESVAHKLWQERTNLIVCEWVELQLELGKADCEVKWNHWHKK